MGAWLSKVIKLLVKYGPIVYNGVKTVIPILWEFRRILPANRKINKLNKEEDDEVTEPIAPSHPP